MLRLGHDGKGLQVYGASDLPSLITRTFTFSATAYLNMLLTGLAIGPVVEEGAGVAGRPDVRIKMTYACGAPLAQFIGEWAELFNGIFENPNMVRRVLEESLLLRMVRAISAPMGQRWKSSLAGSIPTTSSKEYSNTSGYAAMDTTPEKRGTTCGRKSGRGNEAGLSQQTIDRMTSVVESTMFRLERDGGDHSGSGRSGRRTAAKANLLEDLDRTAGISADDKALMQSQIDGFFEGRGAFVAGFGQIMDTMLLSRPVPVEEDWGLADLDPGSGAGTGAHAPGSRSRRPGCFVYLDRSGSPDLVPDLSDCHAGEELGRKPLFRSVMQLRATRLYTAPLQHDSLLVTPLPEGANVTVEGTFAFVDGTYRSRTARPFWLFVRAGYGTYGCRSGAARTSTTCVISAARQALDLKDPLAPPLPEPNPQPDLANIDPAPPNTLDYSPWVARVRRAIEAPQDSGGMNDVQLFYKLIMGEMKLEMFGPPGVEKASDQLVYEVLAHLNPIERGAFWIQKTADLKCLYYAARLFQLLGERVVATATGQNPQLDAIAQQMALWNQQRRREDVLLDLDCTANADMDIVLLLIESAIKLIPSVITNVDLTTQGGSHKNRLETWRRKRKKRR